MNVFGADDQRDNDHAFGFLCPLFSDQEAVNKRWDGHPDQAGGFNEQFIYTPISAIYDFIGNEFNRFNKRAFAGEAKLADTFSDFYMLL